MLVWTVETANRKGSVSVFPSETPGGVVRISVNTGRPGFWRCTARPMRSASRGYAEKSPEAELQWDRLSSLSFSPIPVALPAASQENRPPIPVGAAPSIVLRGIHAEHYQ